MNLADQRRYRYAVRVILPALLKRVKNFDAQKLFNFSDGIYVNPLRAHCLKRTLMSFVFIQPEDEEVHRFKFTIFCSPLDVIRDELNDWGKWSINLCFRFLHHFADIRTLLQ